MLSFLLFLLFMSGREILKASAATCNFSLGSTESLTLFARPRAMQSLMQSVQSELETLNLWVKLSVDSPRVEGEPFRESLPFFAMLESSSPVAHVLVRVQPLRILLLGRRLLRSLSPIEDDRFPGWMTLSPSFLNINLRRLDSSTVNLEIWVGETRTYSGPAYLDPKGPQHEIDIWRPFFQMGNRPARPEEIGYKLYEGTSSFKGSASRLQLWVNANGLAHEDIIANSTSAHEDRLLLDDPASYVTGSASGVRCVEMAEEGEEKEEDEDEERPKVRQAGDELTFCGAPCRRNFDRLRELNRRSLAIVVWRRIVAEEKEEELRRRKEEEEDRRMWKKIEKEIEEEEEEKGEDTREGRMAKEAWKEAVRKTMEVLGRGGGGGGGGGGGRGNDRRDL